MTLHNTEDEVFLYQRHKYFIKDEDGNTIATFSLVCKDIEEQRYRKMNKYMECKYPPKVLLYGRVEAQYIVTCYDMPTRKEIRIPTPSLSEYVRPFDDSLWE
jgi:hypothetical protein